MMLYRYQRAETGKFIQLKARCSLRGDLMKPGTHFDPRQFTTYTADRTTQRLHLALHAQQNMPVEHFDIKSVYIHGKCNHNRPVYIKQMPRFNSTFAHDSVYDKVQGII